MCQKSWEIMKISKILKSSEIDPRTSENRFGVVLMTFGDSYDTRGSTHHDSENLEFSQKSCKIMKSSKISKPSEIDPRMSEKPLWSLSHDFGD